MKICYFIITFIFCYSSVTLANWFPVGKEGAKTIWTKQKKCEAQEGQRCFDVTGKDIRYYEPKTQMVDDLTKPIYKPKYKLKACDSPDDCSNKITAEAEDYCQNGDGLKVEKNQVMPGYSYFCTGITGYEQKEETVLAINDAKKAEVDAADQAVAQEKIAYGKLARDAQFGAAMIGMVGLRLRSKDLNRQQTKQVMRDYRELIDLLRVGSIVHAKEEVETLTPDGVKISEADKAALLAEINAYLGQ